MYVPAAHGLDGDDLRQKAPGTFPPKYYQNLLDVGNVLGVIGTRADFVACDDKVKTRFTNSGEVSLIGLLARPFFGVYSLCYLVARAIVPPPTRPASRCKAPNSYLGG